MDAIKIILLIIVGIFAIYIAFRIAALAIAKSWKQIMHPDICDKCENRKEDRK